MAIFNALLNLRELKELYSGKPVCVCPLYKGVINATKTFEATGNPIVLPEYKSLVKLKTTFSPKQAGTGDPSPENVRPISGYDSLAVNVRGKNLFGGESIEGVIDANGDQLIVGQIIQYPTFITRINPGETYTASRKTTGVIRLGVSPEKPYLGMTFSNALSTTSNKLSITAGENDKWLACNVPYYQDDEVQLEEGSTPTPYEPYQGETATLTLPETIYGGTVDAVTGVGSKEWFTVTLTGNETWTVWGASRPNSFYTDIEGHKNIANNAINVFCSSFLYDVSEERYEPYHFFSQNPGTYPDNVRLCFSFDETVTNVELAKQWIADQASAGTPVQVAYKLANPEPFKVSQVSIPSLRGENYFFTNGENMDIIYKESIFWSDEA